MTVNVIYNLLGKLENIIVAKGIRLLPLPYAIVDVKKIEDILDRIRVSIPGEIQEAREILRRKDEILMDAQNKHDQMLIEAQENAKGMLNESELLKAVQAEAERIKAEVIEDCEGMRSLAKKEIEQARINAANEAVQIREGADRYAEEVLINLDQDLTNLHEIVKNGQRHLAQLKAEAMTRMTTISPAEKEFQPEYDEIPN